MHGEDKDADARIIVVKFFGDFDARHAWQGNIENRDIRLQLPEQVKHFSGFGGFAYDFETGFSRQ